MLFFRLIFFFYEFWEGRGKEGGEGRREGEGRGRGKEGGREGRREGQGRGGEGREGGRKGGRERERRRLIFIFLFLDPLTKRSSFIWEEPTTCMCLVVNLLTLLGTIFVILGICGE